MCLCKTKKRNRREKCKQTPPNMASPIYDVNKSVPSNISHVIACANESLYGHELRNINFQPSSVQHSTPMNLQQPQQMSLPAMSLPPMRIAHTGPSVNPLSMNSNTFTLPAQNLTSHVQTDNSTLQMLFNTINQMNKRLNKLDMLHDLCARRSNMEKHFNQLENDILDIKNYLRQQSQRISDKEFHYNIVETRVSAIEYAKDQLQ